MSMLSMEGLSPDQAPPLSIPLSFFFIAPAAMIGAGLLLAFDGPTMIWTRWTPATMAMAHLGTLGLLGAVMFGALYQMIPVVAGKPVPAVRLAHLVFAAFVIGLVALLYAFISGRQIAFWIAATALGTALILFLVPVAIALTFAPTRSDTVRGIRLAVLGLSSVAGLGLTLAWGRASGSLAGDWIAWTVSHVGMGLIVWVGGLITAVSWQVIPMFYLADPLPRWSRIATLCALAISAVAMISSLAWGAAPAWIAVSASFGAAMIWLVHPVVAMLKLHGRRRRRADISLRFWYSGLACAPFVFLAAAAALWLDDTRWPLVLGWIAVWGWAALIIHGMLTRIVPFIVWFHRFAALVGKTPVPPMRRMLPERRAMIGYWLHVATLLLGCAALASSLGPLARLTGATMAGTGIALASALFGVLKKTAGQRQASSS